MWPFRKLILTELDYPTSPGQDADEATIKLYEDTNSHLKILCDQGATCLYGISGFSGSKGTTYNLANGGKPLGLVFWGSPHWGGDDCSPDGMTNSSQFKTNAFESMSWLSPQALVLMTFHQQYKVEFWNPGFNSPGFNNGSDNRDPSRQLICSPTFFRKYRPTASGTQHHYLCEVDRVMVGLLVPSRFRHLVVYRDHELDVGMTMLNTLEHLAEGEYAMELGGQSFELGLEIHLARQERTRTRSCGARSRARTPPAQAMDEEVWAMPPPTFPPLVAPSPPGKPPGPTRGRGSNEE